MQLAANRNARPDHVAVQTNSTGRISPAQHHHLRRYLLAELLMLLAAVLLVTFGFNTHRLWLVAATLVVVVANAPRIWDLAGDVFAGRSEAIEISSETPARQPSPTSWPRERHQATWRRSVNRGDTLICADDDALSGAMQSMSTGTCHVAKRTRLLLSVSPAARNNGSESLATVMQINDMAIGSIMHRLVSDNQTPTLQSRLHIPVLATTVRGEALATVALLQRCVSEGKSLLYRNRTPRRVPAAQRSVETPAVNLRGKPAGRVSVAR